MATLTQPEIDDIRLSIGDGCDKLMDTQIQAAYDRAEGDECGTNYLLSRALWTSVRPALIQLANGATGFSRTLSDVYKERMELWAACAPASLVGGKTLEVGTLNLAIDTTPADLDNPLATWLYPE